MTTITVNAEVSLEDVLDEVSASDIVEAVGAEEILVAAIEATDVEDAVCALIDEHCVEAVLRAILKCSAGEEIRELMAKYGTKPKGVRSLVRNRLPERMTAGTSLQGYIRRTYAQLTKVLGQPDKFESDPGDGKVSTQWAFRFSDGTVATIYDYKATSLYDSALPDPAELRESDFSDWHIGGNSSRAAELVAELFAEGGEE